MTSTGREDEAGATSTHRSHPGTRFATCRQLQPPVRSDAQIIQVGVERKRCRRALQAAPNGGSASGYQAIFAPSAALGSPGYDGATARIFIHHRA